MALSAGAFALAGAHADVAVQALGAMVGPVRLRLPDGRTLSPMYRAPWHGEDNVEGHGEGHGKGDEESDPGPGDNPLLRHLNGEWLCAPYGPASGPARLPEGWSPRAAGDGMEADRGCDHGWIANQPWQLAGRDAAELRLAIVPPPRHALARVERVVRLLPQAPGIEVVTTLLPRRDVTWPVALHPTFVLPDEGIELRPGPFRAAHAYPVAPVDGVSRLQPGAQAATLAAVPAADGTPIDLRRLPLPGRTEELLQLEDAQPPFTLRLAAAGGRAPVDLELDWDATVLPDLLLWISQGGRSHAPWNGRNRALGVEPCASCFDLTRVAEPAAGHPLARRRGIGLRAGVPLSLRWSLRARVVTG